jgi:hypothetical protein
MKKLILLSVIFSTQAFAQGNVHLECRPKQPCLYAARGLNSCLDKVDLNGVAGGHGTETVWLRQADPRIEVMLVPQKYNVVIGLSANKLSFNDRDGEQWGSLLAGGGAIHGTVTVDEDFQFQVTCRKVASTTSYR